MGAPPEEGSASDGEGPVHRVTLAPFRIAPTTVTNDDFRRVLRRHGVRDTRRGRALVVRFRRPATRMTSRRRVGSPRRRGGGRSKEPTGATPTAPTFRHRRSPRSSGRARHVGRRRGLLRLGRRSSPDRGRMGIRRRGGLEQRRFPWGDELEPDGEHRMNVFQGSFPDADTAADGFAGTAPVTRSPPTDSGSTRSPATCGSGARTGSTSRRTARRRGSTRRARSPARTG